MSQTALQWLRAGGRIYGAQRERGTMASAPRTTSASPCCRLMLIKLPRGSNEVDHYRCAECGQLFVWSGSGWVACELQDKHRAQSRETVRR
jgi:hypothetical protein